MDQDNFNLGWIDNRVPLATPGCPVNGLLKWGTVVPPESGHRRFVDEYSSPFLVADNMEDCRAQANELLQEMNYILRDKDALKKHPELKVLALEKKYVENTREGDVVPKIYFQFTPDKEGKPFHSNCRVFWDCATTVGATDRSFVSGVVETETGINECTQPRYTDMCYTNKVLGRPSNFCTPLSMRDELGVRCRAWYDALPEDVGSTNQSTVAEEICERYPFLDECSCLQRHLDPKFQMANQGQFGPVSDVCWWSPCKMSGFDRRITPSMDRSRNNCKSNFCGNFISTLDSQSVTFLDELKQVVSCTSEEWAAGDQKQTGNENNGGGAVVDHSSSIISTGDGGDTSEHSSDSVNVFQDYFKSTTKEDKDVEESPWWVPLVYGCVILFVFFIGYLWNKSRK